MNAQAHVVPEPSTADVPFAPVFCLSLATLTFASIRFHAWYLPLSSAKAPPSRWHFAICCISIALSAGLLVVVLLGIPGIHILYDNSFQRAHLGLLLLDFSLIGLYETETLRHAFDQGHSQAQYFYLVVMVVIAFLSAGNFIWILVRIDRPALILRVLLLETAAIYVILSLAYLYLSVTRRKKEDRLLLWSNLVCCALVSVVHGVGVLLAGHIPGGLIFSVWIVFALSSLVTIRFWCRLLWRRRRARIGLEKQLKDDRDVSLVVSLAEMLQNILLLGPAKLRLMPPTLLLFSYYTGHSRPGPSHALVASLVEMSANIFSSSSSRIPLMRSVLLDFHRNFHYSSASARATLALRDLLSYTLVLAPEIDDIISQLAPEELRLLCCARRTFPEKGSLYRFASEKTNTQREDLRAIGALYNQVLTVNEICALWNCLMESIQQKMKFLAGDKGDLWIYGSAEVHFPLCVPLEQIYENATQAVQELVIRLTPPGSQAKPSSATSDIIKRLAPNQLSLLCFMAWRFTKPRALYGACFGREWNHHEWANVRRCYVDYSQNEVTFFGMTFVLEDILGIVYWSRMLKGRDEYSVQRQD